jgi:hypothetical protein
LIQDRKLYKSNRNYKGFWFIYKAH